VSRIEWTEVTWNPVTGCDKVSTGCDHCYALRMAGRLKAMGQGKYQRDGDPRTSGPGFGVTCHPASLALPYRWRQPRLVFVNSMSDLFHPKVPDAFIARVFLVMAGTPHHTYQVLTKRPARMRAMLAWPEFTSAIRPRPWDCGWPLPNVWLGVSAEDQRWADRRIPLLLDTPAAVRFISAEPLLGPIDLTAAAWSRWSATPPRWYQRAGLGGIGWVIAGGESGPGYRSVDLDRVRSLRDQCQKAGVPFFYKQQGGPASKAGGRVLDGRTWDQMPASGPPGRPPDTRMRSRRTAAKARTPGPLTSHPRAPQEDRRRRRLPA
jgi:protein gp37